MHSIIYGKMMKAKKEKDLELMKTLYENNSNNLQISLEYAKLLAEKNNLDEARSLLLYLLNTQIDTCAMLELGRLEKEVGNIDLARSYFKKLLSHNQTNRYALVELGILENNFGNKNLARKYFKELIKDPDGKHDAYPLLILLEISEQNYKLAVKYLNKALKEKVSINPNLILYISKKLNIFFNIDYSKIKYSYSLEQLLDYDEYICLEHILYRHENENLGNLDFNERIEVYTLFNEVKQLLTKENKINNLILNDWYLIKYQNVGSRGENYLFVVTQPNSKNIITMYPVKSKKCINKYLKEYEDTDQKVLIKK